MSTTPRKKSAATGRKAVSAARRNDEATRTVSSEVNLPENERRRMIAEAAYYRAERRGFSAGHEVDDWLAAEHEIAQRLDATAAGTPTSGTVKRRGAREKRI